MSHVQEDIQKLSDDYRKGFSEALESSSVPKDNAYIENKMQAYEASIKSPSEQERLVAELKEQLMAVHAEALEYKTNLTESQSNSFVSVIDDLSDVKESLTKLSEKDTQKRLKELADARLKELTERPDFSSFKDKDELVNTVHLITKYDEEIGQAETSLWKKVQEENELKEKELIASNPILKKLRNKSKVSGFFNTENSYYNENSFQKAVQEEKSRVGFQPATKNDFPQHQEAINKLRSEKEALQDKLEVMKKDYQENARSLAEHKNAPHPYFVSRIEQTIKDNPTADTFEELSYKEKVFKFKNLKEKYVSESLKLQNPEESKAKYREQVVSQAPYDKNALKTFKEEVYNKSPKTKKLLQTLEEKTQQKYISAGYRNNLQKEIYSNKRDIGDMEEIARLEALKKKYDTLAEIEIGKNRLKSLA